MEIFYPSLHSFHRRIWVTILGAMGGIGRNENFARRHVKKTWRTTFHPGNRSMPTSTFFIAQSAASYDQAPISVLPWAMFTRLPQKILNSQSLFDQPNRLKTDLLLLTLKIYARCPLPMTLFPPSRLLLPQSRCRGWSQVLPAWNLNYYLADIPGPCSRLSKNKKILVQSLIQVMVFRPTL